jgi:hypothetical protein
MIIPSASIVFESGFSWTPPTAGAAGSFRGVASDRVEVSATSAIKLNLLPVATTTYLLDNFPAIELDNVSVQTLSGFASSFEKVKGIHIRVSAYDPDSASSGTVTATLTDLFGTQDSAHILGIGDNIAITRRTGITAVGTTAVQLVATSPVNLRIEVILLGDAVSGAGT